MQPGTPWKPERPCCSGRVTNSTPFALTPSIYGGTLSPRGRLWGWGGHWAHNICPSFNPQTPTLQQLLQRPFSTKARHTHTPAERVRGRRTITIWPCSAEEEESSSHTRRQENMLLLFFSVLFFFPQSFLFARPLRDHGCHDIISPGHFPWPVPPPPAWLPCQSHDY